MNVMEKLGQLENKFTKAQNRARECLDETKVEFSNSGEMDKTKAESSSSDAITSNEEQGKRSKFGFSKL